MTPCVRCQQDASDGWIIPIKNGWQLAESLEGTITVPKLDWIHVCENCMSSEDHILIADLNSTTRADFANIMGRSNIQLPPLDPG